MENELATQEDNSGYDVAKLEGVDKAAILLLSLSEEDAAQILKHLEPKQVQKLGSAMAKVDDMTQPKITAVHKHFIEEIQNYSTIGFQSQDYEQRFQKFFVCYKVFDFQVYQNQRLRNRVSRARLVAGIVFR